MAIIHHSQVLTTYTGISNICLLGMNVVLQGPNWDFSSLQRLWHLMYKRQFYLKLNSVSRHVFCFVYSKLLYVYGANWLIGAHIQMDDGYGVFFLWILGIHNI